MLILVVDDEESLCELIAEVLSENYQIVKAYNGREALEIARTLSPDLIVSDIMMPEMSGVELLKRLRQKPETAHIPVILLSAASSQSVAWQAQAFLRKPFEIELLEQVVFEVAASSTIINKTQENGFENFEKNPEKWRDENAVSEAEFAEKKDPFEFRPIPKANPLPHSTQPPFLQAGLTLDREQGWSEAAFEPINFNRPNRKIN